MRPGVIHRPFGRMILIFLAVDEFGLWLRT
jgi:hypothetical protein